MPTRIVPDAPRLKTIHLVSVILLTIITFGLYGPNWFLKRREALNALESPTKLGVLAPLLLFGAQLLYLCADAWRPHAIHGSLAGHLARLAIGFGGAALSLRVRRILLDHFEARARREIPGRSSLRAFTRVSGIWTFIFQFWYLQYKINGYQRELYSRSRPDEGVGRRTSGCS